MWRGPGVHRKQDDPAQLAAEASRLTWLGDHGIPCPTVLSLDDDGMVTTTLRGRPAHEHPHQWPRTTAAHAQVLRDLHRLPVEACPFDETLATTLHRASRAVLTDGVDLSNLDAARRGRSAAQLLDESC